MARPRIHDPDLVLDAAEALAVDGGPAAVTIRAVAAATGISNGALYHSFGSRAELLGRTWIRAARRFLAVQAELVDHAGDPVAAVLAAADAPAEFAARHPRSTELVFRIRRTDLLGADLPDTVRADLDATQTTLVELMKTLARRLLGPRRRARRGHPHPVPGRPADSDPARPRPAHRSHRPPPVAGRGPRGPRPRARTGLNTPEGHPCPP